MKGKQLKIILALAAMALLVSIYGCGENSNEAEANVNIEIEESIPVEVTQVSMGTVSASYFGSATLEAKDEAVVASKTQGTVQKIFVEEGNYVKTGQLLAKLDDQQLKLEYDLSKSRLENLESKFARSDKLFKKNIISTEAYEQIKFELQNQKITVALARLQLDYTKIIAPISGIITDRKIAIGNLVSTHEQVFRVTDFDPLYATLHVPETQINKIKKGQSAILTIDALKSSTITGKVLRISPVVDSRTGTFKAIIQVKNSDRKIKPGMFARVNIVHDTHKNVMLIPKDAILTEGEETAVFVISEGIVLPATFEILKDTVENLKPGDMVKILADALPDADIYGRIARIEMVAATDPGLIKKIMSKFGFETEADTGADKFEVIIKIDNTDKKFTPELFEKVAFDYQDKKINLEISENGVFKANLAHKKKVELGFSNAKKVEVAGVTAVATVVTTGINNLKEDTLVKIVD